ncbi:hypothetical protein NNO07_06135 [Pseudomonas resinovorans]|uniref:EF-hand domain-containing protein n=1 Tax=Metapseudomonas resinovorans TaxID=53412 RepID=A0ABT4Y1T6_METRE|nr:hypothetical protein [Pseudomonas resinovorans]MDA8482642.1 hypothetical protein [Pseudomonas resinovorans]
MNFHYPIRKPDKTPFTNANELYEALEREIGGYYLLGANGFWHGGIHISDRSAPHCILDDPLCCMADGEVVAYRLNDNYRESTFGDGASAKKLKYSNSFCLIRHEYRSPPNPEEGANHGKQNTLTFYSLYMHLLPYNHYRSSERLRPRYWQGKVRGTAHRRLPLYNAPLNQAEGEPAGTRIGKRELCVSSVVEFDSQEVVTLRIGDQRHRMAQCKLVSGGCWGPESVPPTFWTIVDDNLLRWETVTPAAFNGVVSANTPIKAGDPIGYLGQIENIRSEEGETDSRYQVHLEIFTTDAELQAFLQNAAGLKTGKQYLHVPSGTVLRKPAPSSELVTLTRPHALELSRTPLVQDGGQDCYEVRVIENDQPVSGLLMKADAHIITQHDWEKLGFQIVEEQDPMADGFLDVEAMPPFFRDLFAKLDSNRDGALSADELTAGLRNPALRDQWARLVAHHPTEWQEKAASPKWLRLDKLFGGIPKALKHEKQRIDNFVFWDELPATVGLASGLLYHFHPIAFIEAMRGPVNNPTPLTGPGFYIVPRSMSGEQILAELALTGSTAHLRLKELNPTFAQGFKAGELFVLGDSEGGMMCTREEAALMLAAEQARTALEPLSASEADFMVRHQGEIAGMLGTASLSMGIAHDTYGVGLKQIDVTLRDIELLHQREFARHGHLRSPEFFATRQQLYRQLDIQLKATFLNKPLGLGSYDNLRRDLGISTRSLVHHWSKAGVPGQIPGYATHLAEVAKVAKYLKYGGFVGIAVGGAASSLKVQEVCRAGDTEACEKIRFTEAGSFTVGLAGGIAFGAIANSFAAAPICAVIGVGSAGVGGLACALVVAGGASYLGSTLGAKGGELAGEKIYERSQQ